MTKPLLTLENIRSGAVPSDAHAVGFLLGEIERLRAENALQWQNVQELLAENAKLQGASHEPGAVLTDDEIKALKCILEYAKSEHGKSQGGYFSYGGWAGYTLTKLLERAQPSEKSGEDPSKRYFTVTNPPE